MSSHLIVVSIGPVQDFIAQARRTRDLWYGSHLLSELSKAAAWSLAQVGDLVFPALDASDPRLHPTDQPVKPDGEPVFGVGNKLLAELPEGVDPTDAARAARKGALDHLATLANGVKGRCQGALAAGIDAAWREQIESFLEFTAAWAPVSAGGYAAAWRDAEALLAARKGLREFAAWKAQRGAVPKSSLDGGRETVLAPPQQRHLGQGAWRRYRIGLGEQLDAVGLLKRAGGEPERFAPIANVAAAGWLLRRRSCLATLAAASKTAGLPEIRRPWPWVQAFPFDAQLLRQTQWRALTEEGLVSAEWLEEHVVPVLKDAGAPPSYVACLVADGDHMGAVLDRLAAAEGHRKLSRALADFSAAARGIVEKEHDGVLVYAGGDDVLGFVCVERALQCAQALAEAFRQFAAPAYPPGLTPSLSVGVGVGHVLENMADLLRLGRDAEKLAKRSRDALGVLVSKRSGGDVEWSSRWRGLPVQSIEAALEALAKGRVSVRKVYEVSALSRRARAAGEPGLGRMLAADTWRTLSRSEGQAGAPQSPAELGLDLSGADDEAVLAAIDEWVRRFRVALHFRGGQS